MRALLIASMFAAGLAAPAMAADAARPYNNVDHKVDAGNGTGNQRTQDLNQGELNQIQNPTAPGIGTVPTQPPAHPAAQ